MLECVANISEGADLMSVRALGEAVGIDVLDIHSDPDHHRSVFTMVGTRAVRRLATAAVASQDIERHRGVHPRLGVVDVVPFVPLGGATLDDAIAARDDFARWLADELAVPCFLYGPERTLPDVRRRAFDELAPDVGPRRPHPTAGATCVGARQQLVAYNLWLADSTLSAARNIAAAIRCREVRALGLQVGPEVQVSINLVEPTRVGPAQVYDAVAALGRVARAELVGLIGAEVLAAIPRRRWSELDVGPEKTIEMCVTRWALGQA